MESLYCAAKIMRETTRSNIKVKRLFFTFVVRNHNLLTHKPEKYAPSLNTHRYEQFSSKVLFRFKLIVQLLYDLGSIGMESIHVF